MTKEEFEQELTALMIRAVDNGVPGDEVAAVTYQSGATLLGVLIGVDKAIPIMMKTAEALRTASAFNKGDVGGKA
jgi:hypothetical protein